jgi:hypothetical protein
MNDEGDDCMGTVPLWSVLFSAPRRCFAGLKENVLLKLTLVLSRIAVALTDL